MGRMFSQLVAKFAFFPPSPPTYQIKKDDNNGKLKVVSSSSMPAPVADDPSLDVLLIDTKHGNKIVDFYLKNPYARLAVLYSHGTAADLGQLYDLFVQLKVNFRVNLMGVSMTILAMVHQLGRDDHPLFNIFIVVVDSSRILYFVFSSYLNGGVFANIEAVYQCLQTEYGISQEDLILYGESVGSGPMLHLAAKLPRLRGVVLHRSILSGLSVLCHVKFSFCFDIYQLLYRISKLVGIGSNILVRVRKMMLSIGCKEMDFGKWQGNRTSLCGSKEVVTATWSYTLIIFAIFASLFIKWRTRQHRLALKGFGRVSVYQQGRMPSPRLPVTGSVRLNYAPNVQNQSANVAGDRSGFAVGNRNAQNAEGDGNSMDLSEVDIRLPMLVYVTLEKRPGYDHKEKAGAMNALFPQRFEGIDPSDRYANHNTVFFDVNMRALDGLQGPVYVGTGCLFFALPSMVLSHLGEVLDTLFQQGLDITIEEEKPEYIEDKEWETINRLACSTIRSCLSREQKYGYKNKTSASTSMNEHITAFNELVEDLLGMDETFKDEDLALMLLSSLPDEFEHLETTLLHGKDNVPLKMYTALYSYELMKKTKKDSKYEAAEAMVARGRSKSQNPKWRGRSKSKSILGKDECAFCHEKGHWKKDCPKLKKKGKVAPDACVAEHDAHDSDISLVASLTTFHSDEWILDSGCTYHMSPNREWFSDLVELNARVVYIGNDNDCKTVGIGSIRLKNQDGSTRVLTDVRYVPSLKKNLISLGALESKGSVVTMRDGVLKVTYGALVMMKGIRKNNLYYYQGRTIIGTVAAASGGDDLDATHLLHMRLGHAGEKSLQILAKKGLLKGAKACKLNFYEHCVLGKQKRVKFGTTVHNTKDAFSRRVWVYPMKSKDEVLQIFLKWTNMIENQTGKAFWAEAVTYTGHLINRLPSSAIGGKTPLENTFFMGITHGVKGFRLWCLDTKKIICSRDVTFDESSLVKKVTSEAVQTSSTPHQVEYTPKQVEFQQTMIPEVDAADSLTPIEESEDEEVQTQEPLETPEPLAVTRPRREIRRPARFVDMVAYTLPVVDDDIPITYQETIQSLDNDKWKSVMDEEMQSLQKNNTWKLAQLPKGKRAIGCKWVFVNKDGSHSKKYVRYKARLVTKGYAQKEGIDYNEVFSPVMKHSSIRILLALVAQLNLELAQLDVKTAFLHDDLEEEIYMTQSEGYKDGGCEKWVCKLNKSLYGLKQSPRQWYKRFDSFMRRQKYTRSKYDQCVYLQKLKDGSFIYLLFSQLSTKTNEERVYMAKVPYANAAGSLMYAMVCTRPDISQAVGVVSMYMHDPGEGHWQVVKWILRYLQQTVDVGLVFEQDEALGQCVVGYADFDYAGDLDKCRSTIGYLFTLAKAPVSWKSTLQSTVALSTTEAGYMSVSEAVKEAIWLNWLMEDLRVVQSHISLYCDSQSAIHLAKNQVYHSRTKHIDVMLDPPRAEPQNGTEGDGNSMDLSEVDIRLPMLVYVTREKRPGYDHKEKAGAMNALVRASAIMSNGPFILNLDCDHYIYNSLAMREGICFMMDRDGERICYVQFPQRFEGIDPSDRYANHNTVFFDVNMRALDGLQGPVYVGTGCLFRRTALYGFEPPRLEDNPGCCSCCFPRCKKPATVASAPDVDTEDAHNSRPSPCRSSFCRIWASTALTVPREPLDPSTIAEAINVIPCWYEDKTEWGQSVGWIYGSVTEDVVTGVLLILTLGYTLSLPYSSSSTASFPHFPSFRINSSSIAYLHGCGYNGYYYGHCGYHDHEFFSEAVLEIKWSGIELEEWWRNEQFWLIVGTSAHLAAVLQGLLKVIAGIEKSAGDEGDDDFADLYIFKWTSLMIPPLTIIFVNLIAIAYGIIRTVYSTDPEWSHLLGVVFFSF
ncbi:Cellulose synthase-like protein D2 [Hibiscus syriacus]|uniref:Cellulose synthase-like protein D2 n=1 Tax=Hibiscus syriacus TaxID=106335 RepID=A0A6A2ZN97_HIBSY|nr:Cellulose synthase-like protein D2 [Hibiscus syriacus]